jgi:CDP-glucose 4,6-dehydratase
MGTVNLLDIAFKKDFVKAIVVVTTDKVYRNDNSGQSFVESDPLEGKDPYSASKVGTESVVAAWQQIAKVSGGPSLASVRAGNVIGGGDWSEDRLIPDAIRAWDANFPLEIRRPNAVRPWQHVLEPLNGYLVLAEKLYTDLSFSGAYNFGPKADEAATVKAVIRLANQAYGTGSVLLGDGVGGPHEASLLSLEISKAQEVLDIRPRWNLLETVERTMGWYQQQRSGVNVHQLCDADIVAFSSTRKA